MTTTPHPSDNFHTLLAKLLLAFGLAADPEDSDELLLQKLLGAVNNPTSVEGLTDSVSFYDHSDARHDITLVGGRVTSWQQTPESIPGVGDPET